MLDCPPQSKIRPNMTPASPCVATALPSSISVRLSVCLAKRVQPAVAVSKGPATAMGGARPFRRAQIMSHTVPRQTDKRGGGGGTHMERDAFCGGSLTAHAPPLPASTVPLPTSLPSRATATENAPAARKPGSGVGEVPASRPGSGGAREHVGQRHREGRNAAATTGGTAPHRAGFGPVQAGAFVSSYPRGIPT